MNPYNEKKAKFTEYLRRFHNSPKTVDDYVSFVGKCAWALSQGSSLTWGDLAEIAKEVGILLTIPENSDYVSSKETKTMFRHLSELSHYSELPESYREVLSPVPLKESTMFDVDGFARTVQLAVNPNNEIVVLFTGGFATSKCAHIAEECIGKLWGVIAKNNSNTPVSKEYKIESLGFNYFIIKSFGMLKLLKPLIPDKEIVNQLLDANVDILGGSFHKPLYKIKDFWYEITINLAKKGYKIMKVDE